MEKKRAIILCLVFFLTIFGFTAAHLLMEDEDISKTERRPLKSTPELSSDAVFSGKFSKDLEDYLLDQFPLRDPIRRVNTLMRYYALGIHDNNGIVTRGNMVFEEERYQEGQLRYGIKKLNGVQETYLGDAKVYFALIPDKCAFVESTSGVQIDYPHMRGVLREELTDMQHIDIWDMLELEDYYDTDLHWKQECIYPVAEKLASEMGIQLVPYEAYKPQALYPFYGSYFNRTVRLPEPDTLTYMSSSYTDKAVVTDHEGVESAVYVPSEIDSVDGYNVYLSGTQAVLTVEVEGALTDRELIIFRDSFGSSIAPYFLGAYSKVTLVDLRYVASSELDQYVNFADQDVLFLYSTTILNRGSLLR